MDESTALTNREKLLAALAAAMGGGCRTCAEKLFSMADPAGATTEDIEHAFSEGLRARESATEVMRKKATALLGRPPGSAATPYPGLEPRITELSRLAAAAAANSSPDALKHVEAAASAGATDAEIGVAIGIAQSVRSKAQDFSDEEIGLARKEEPVSEKTCTDAAAGSADRGSQGETICCGGKNAQPIDPGD